MTEPEMRGVDDAAYEVPRPAGGRLLRGCDVCCQVDADPRHTLGVPAGWPGAVPAQAVIGRIIAAAAGSEASPEEVAHLVTEQLDPLTVVRHMDCCAANGCIDGSCRQVLADAGGKTRTALVKYVEAAVAAIDAGKD